MKHSTFITAIALSSVAVALPAQNARAQLEDRY